MKSKRFSNTGDRKAVTLRKSRLSVLHAKKPKSSALKFRLSPPKSPSHIGRSMERIGKSQKLVIKANAKFSDSDIAVLFRNVQHAKRFCSMCLARSGRFPSSPSNLL